MGQITIGEQAAPATPASGITLYATIATPSRLHMIDDGGNDRIITPWVIFPTTFTPAITFGGGNTGITYTTQVGFYEQIGGHVFAQGYIALSNKGSSTGVVRVTGLPVTSNTTSNYFQPVFLRLDVMSSISGYIQGFISTNATEFRIEHLGTGTAAELTHANFNNTSNIMFKAIYAAA